MRMVLSRSFVPIPPQTSEGRASCHLLARARGKTRALKSESRCAVRKPCAHPTTNSREPGIVSLPRTGKTLEAKDDAPPKMHLGSWVASALVRVRSQASHSADALTIAVPRPATDTPAASVGAVEVAFFTPPEREKRRNAIVGVWGLPPPQ